MIDLPPGNYGTIVLSAVTLSNGLVIVTRQIIEGKYKGRKIYHRFRPESLDSTFKLLEDVVQNYEDGVYEWDNDEWDDEDDDDDEVEVSW